MAIVTTLSKDNLDYTIFQIIYEWMSNASCFGEQTDNSLTKIADIVLYMKLYSGDLPCPQVNVELIPLTIKSTGAGEVGERKEFRSYNAHIRIITDSTVRKYAGELGALQIGDILTKFHRDATNGKPALQIAGLRKNRLIGGFPSPDDNYTYRDYYMTFEVCI